MSSGLLLPFLSLPHLSKSLLPDDWCNFMLMLDPKVISNQVSIYFDTRLSFISSLLVHSLCLCTIKKFKKKKFVPPLAPFRPGNPFPQLNPCYHPHPDVSCVAFTVCPLHSPFPSPNDNWEVSKRDKDTWWVLNAWSLAWNVVLVLVGNQARGWWGWLWIRQLCLSLVGFVAPVHWLLQRPLLCGDVGMPTLGID